MSPLTLATTRSRISAPSGAASRTKLGTRIFQDFMVHLGAGQGRPHEIARRLVRFLPPEPDANLVPALVHAPLAGRLALVHMQDMVAERGGNDLARRSDGQGESGLVQLGRQLAPGETAHEAPLARLRRAGAGLGQGCEAPRLLLEAAQHIAGFALAR